MIKTDSLQNNCTSCTTAECFIKQSCNSESLTIINGLKQNSIYRANQYIAHQGNDVLGLFFIQNGKAKIVSTGIMGKNQIVRLTKKGDIIGHRGYGGEKYPISAISIEDSSVCFIDNDTMYKAFMENPKLTFELMMYYSKELRKSEYKIKIQAQMNVREKVIDALLNCYRFFKDNNQTSFLIPLTRIDIAGLAGINTEQLSRILSELKKDNLISVSKNEITILNPEVLAEFVSPFGAIE